jgi:transmembrane sensor
MTSSNSNKSSSASGLIEARAADWIAERDRAGAAWPVEREHALQAWIQASTAHRVAWLRLEQAWRRADRLRALQPPPLARTAPSAGLPWWQGQRRKLGGALAGLSLALLAMVVVSEFRHSPDTQRYATARGQREAVALADGSRLTLNTATRLRAAVTAQQREVWLEQGEAFFDIAHDASRPFVIHAGEQTVTVLGTKFSLLREGERLRVAVLEGKVQVQTEPHSRPAVLVRDDTALAEARHVLVSKKSSQQLSASLSWLQGKLVFDQINLAEAAQQFNRYNRKQLVISDDAAGSIGIGGVFDANNAEAFARLLQAGFGLDVQIGEAEIRVASPAS